MHTPRQDVSLGSRPAPLAGLAIVLEEAGGVGAPPERDAQIRSLLLDELAAGERELAQNRSGYGHPVPVAVASSGRKLVAALPIVPELRADPHAAPVRAWLLVAGLIGALIEVAP